MEFIKLLEAMMHLRILLLLLIPFMSTAQDTWQYAEQEAEITRNAATPFEPVVFMVKVGQLPNLDQGIEGYYRDTIDGKDYFWNWAHDVAYNSGVGSGDVPQLDSIVDTSGVYYDYDYAVEHTGHDGSGTNQGVINTDTTDNYPWLYDFYEECARLRNSDSLFVSLNNVPANAEFTLFVQNYIDAGWAGDSLYVESWGDGAGLGDTLLTIVSCPSGDCQSLISAPVEIAQNAGPSGTVTWMIHNNNLGTTGPAYYRIEQTSE